MDSNTEQIFIINTIGKCPHQKNESSNIGHFFHEILFYGIDAFLRNKNVKWVIYDNLTEWELKFTMLCIKYLNINHEFINETSTYRNNNANWCIGGSENFVIIMDLIQEMIKQEFPDINYNGNYKVLYFRNDTHRRKMINYNGTLDKYFDEIVYDFNNMKFEDQVRLFMKTSHFVTIEGAHLTNVIFMNKCAKVFGITPHNNSWQIMFGTSKCIDTFIEYSLGISDFNADIQYNDEIENQIKIFLGVI